MINRLFFLLLLASAAFGQSPPPTPAPPYAEVLERQPYGLTIRLLLAPLNDELPVSIALDDAQIALSYIESKAESPQVRTMQIFAPSDTALRLRFKLQTRRGDSAWSQPLNVRTRPAFKLAPSEPTDFQVGSASPFAFALTWRDTALREHSFEIERCDCGACERLALALPGSGQLRIGGFLPNTSASFRLRAVNSAGHSSWSKVRAARTPPLRGKLAVIGAPDYWQAEQCNTLAELKKQVAEEIQLQKSGGLDGQVWLRKTQLGPKHPTVTVLNPRDCGSGGCLFTVYSEEGACLRKITDQGFTEALDMGDDWPILRMRWHNGAGTTIYTYSQMIDGRYQVVDQSVWTGLITTLPSASTDLEFQMCGLSCPTPAVKEVATERGKR
jgi:hypothetical protein